MEHALKMLKLRASRPFLRRVFTQRLAQLSTAPDISENRKTASFRTQESDPLKHSIDHLGQFYKIPEGDRKLFVHGGLPKLFEKQTKTFNETCLMIRKPSIDIINSLKALDYSKPAVRFVLYGKLGCGRSLCVAHVLHYAYKAGFLLVHVPWVGNWMRKPREVSSSESKEGLYDLNIDAAAWLLHFKSQNAHLLTNPEFQTSKDFVWSKREMTPKGSTLTELVDYGLNRIKYASDCVVYLAEEIKNLSRNGVCKTLVAVDGFNAFFYPNSRIFKERKQIVHPKDVTLTEAFLSLTSHDWNNAAIVAVVDELAIAAEDHISHFPRYLLRKEGFEHLDPFIPIFVDNYSEKEFVSCMDYYRDMKWIRQPPQQDQELSILSVNNPYTLMNLTASL